MVFNTRDEMFSASNDLCFRVMKVNRRSVNLEIYRFDDTGITEVMYKKHVKKSYGNTILDFTGDAEFISFNHKGHRYRFSSEECRNNIY